jgi:hypothetical protein
LQLYELLIKSKEWMPHFRQFLIIGKYHGIWSINRSRSNQW